MDKKTSAIEGLFKKVLETEIVYDLTKDTPLEKIIPYLFYQLFLKYGVGRILSFPAQESHKQECLIFQIDPKKTEGIICWFKAKMVPAYGDSPPMSSMIELFRSKPTVWSDANPAIMTFNFFKGYSKEESQTPGDVVPHFDIYGNVHESLKLNYYLRSTENSLTADVRMGKEKIPVWFITKVLTDDVFPLITGEWIAYHRM